MRIDADREALLGAVAQAMNRFDGQMLAYCLMGNHCRFVLHTRKANLSLLIRHVNGVYTQRFNHRHGKLGHLFQGRFEVILVDREAFLLEVCRYVELSSVRAQMVAVPGEWPRPATWSMWTRRCLRLGLIPSDCMAICWDAKSRAPQTADALRRATPAWWPLGAMWPCGKRRFASRSFWVMTTSRPACPTAFAREGSARANSAVECLHPLGLAHDRDGAMGGSVGVSCEPVDCCGRGAPAGHCRRRALSARCMMRDARRLRR